MGLHHVGSGSPPGSLSCEAASAAWPAGRCPEREGFRTSLGGVWAPPDLRGAEALEEDHPTRQPTSHAGTGTVAHGETGGSGQPAALDLTGPFSTFLRSPRSELTREVGGSPAPASPSRAGARLCPAPRPGAGLVSDDNSRESAQGNKGMEGQEGTSVVLTPRFPNISAHFLGHAHTCLCAQADALGFCSQTIWIQVSESQLSSAS